LNVLRPDLWPKAKIKGVGGLYENFPPVIKLTTILLILAIAVHFHWPVRKLDVSNAFLHGFLEEEVFIEQPKGFVDDTKPDYVCKLHKSLYGHK